jgi:hypothetical protein
MGGAKDKRVTDKIETGNPEIGHDEHHVGSAFQALSDQRDSRGDHPE